MSNPVAATAAVAAPPTTIIKTSAKKGCQLCRCLRCNRIVSYRISLPIASDECGTETTPQTRVYLHRKE